MRNYRHTDLNATNEGELGVKKTIRLCRIKIDVPRGPMNVFNLVTQGFRICGFVSLLLFAGFSGEISAGGMPHPDDPQKHAEHMATMGLVSDQMITHRVIKDGFWSNPTTWEGGQLPGVGANIDVPAGKRLEVDIQSDTPLNAIRVDGELYFSPNRNARITVETIIVRTSGKFTIAEESQRLAKDKKVEILFTAPGPIDTDWDPTQISRGMVIHGQTRIFGSSKKAFYKLSSGAPVGSSQVTLKGIPQGWRIGDTVVISGVYNRGWQWDRDLKKVVYNGTDDERRIITAISGTTVRFDQPLIYDHQPNHPGMPVYIANYTRNVEFRTINGENLPSNQRAHTMFMHNDNVIVKGAGFYHLGRTDKSFALDDFKLDSSGDRIKDAEGNFIPGARTNIRGRYSVHFHRSGGTRPGMMPSICEGNAVIGNPGWGLVIHESHVMMENNASYDVLGAHFVTEDGNEIGIVKNNIAIKAKGRNSGIKEGGHNHDSGHSGHGFWFQGRNMIVEGNIAVSAGEAGFAYFHRNYVFEVQVSADVLVTPLKAISKGDDKLRYNFVPIWHAKNNTVVASNIVLHVVKADPNQYHDLRNVFDGLYGWNTNSGIYIEYTSKYTFKNFSLYADPSSPNLIGARLGSNTQDVVMANGIISGFAKAVWVASGFGNVPPYVDTADVVLIDVQVSGHQDLFATGSSPYPKLEQDPNVQIIMNSDQLVPGRLTFVPENALRIPLPSEANWWNNTTTIWGDKTDSLGTRSSEIIQIYNLHIKNNIIPAGHYTRPDGSKYVIIEDYIADRLTNETIPLVIEIDIPNGHSILGNSKNLGQPTPPTITEHPQDSIGQLGHPLTFSCDASVQGHHYIQYQWQKNGTDIQGAHYKDYTIHSIANNDFGDRYRCVVRTIGGQEISKEGQILQSEATTPPTARITTDLLSGETPLSIHFDGSGSSDPDGTIASYTWDFGDGSSSTKTAPIHIFEAEGTYTVTLIVTDNEGASDSATVAITAITPSANQAPIANSDNVSTQMDQAVTIDVLSNDRDDDGDVIRITTFTMPKNGTVISDGIKLTYTPNSGFTGTNSFDYTINDGNGATASTTVTVTVQDKGSNGLEVISFTCVNAVTDVDIQPLEDGDIIDLSQVGSSLNIRANTNPGVVGSVRFGYDGNASYSLENKAPFALAGDRSGDYFKWTPTLGFHTLTATAYTGSRAGGTAGMPFTINFTVVESFKVKNGSNSSEDGDGSVVISGELKRWHKVTLTLDGPWASETTDPNPFMDYRMDVTFTNGNLTYVVPGHFAADGDAANTSANSGTKWRAHLAPDLTGTWNYTIHFTQGEDVAVNGGGNPLVPYDGITGQFTINETNKSGRDHRGKGRLTYVGKHYLQFAGTGEYFLKQGPDAPENFLAYADFDGDFKSDGIKDNLIKTWGPHAGDWRSGDPTWKGNRGLGIIGAINYLASKGVNSFSFLTMNINGDDKNVFPYTEYNERYRMDVSRLSQWEIVFNHADQMGMYLHFKTQETENDQLLDGGALGPQRKLYYRELISRFSHHLALNWNLGEENTNTDTQRKEFAQFFHDNDPYDHNIVMHTYPGDGQKNAYTSLLGNASKLTGASLQSADASFADVHNDVKTWVEKSANSGKPWVIASDESGHPSHGVIPDAEDPNHDVARKNGLWGTLMAGGAGNEWYFGYSHAHSDLTCEDFGSRDLWWDQCSIALEFFKNNAIPFWQMVNDNNKSSASNDYCFYREGEVYVVYLKNGGSTNLDLSGVSGNFDVKWYDPVNGGDLVDGTIFNVSGGNSRNLGNAPYDTSEDWVIVVRATDSTGNLAPTSLFSVSALTGQAPLSVNVDASNSNDADGMIMAYDWDFGDGTSGIGVTTSHEYATSGSYILVLTVTDDEGAIGREEVTITVIEPNQDPETETITSFTLVNSATNTDIQPLGDGDIIDLAQVGTSLNIRANTNPGVVGSVRFGLDGNSNYRTENVAPYALRGDKKGYYFNWKPPLGSHTLSATPYSGKNARGTAGPKLIINFSVVK